MRFCQTPHRPWWLWIDFLLPPYRYPAGTGSPAILRTLAPKGRRAKWLSAKGQFLVDLGAFRENNPDTLYEDVAMCPGFTHDPFFVVGNDRSFRYPWHRYYAETDCVWMAIELHRL